MIAVLCMKFVACCKHDTVVEYIFDIAFNNRYVGTQMFLGGGGNL